jgi:hypothetical protein
MRMSKIIFVYFSYFTDRFDISSHDVPQKGAMVLGTSLVYMPHTEGTNYTKSIRSELSIYVCYVSGVRSRGVCDISFV